MKPPRHLSTQQRRVLAVEGIKHLGWDEKNRPVVEALSGIPRTLRRWAVKRDGDPTDIVGKVTP